MYASITALVRVDREEQRDVDVDPVRDELAHGLRALGRSRHLDHHVRAGRPSPRGACASEIVAVASFAAPGDTSIDTKPSAPLVAS